MNDLTISKQFQDSFPTVVEGLKKAQNIFDSIKGFEDIERVFLKGNGLSQNTYKSYLQAVKQFYDYTEGLNPLQVKPSHIEAFYDHQVNKVDRNTAYLRIRGLKKFFAGIRNIISFYTSPFELMSEKLEKKLNRTKKGNRTKKALTFKEMKAIFEYLSQDKTLKGKQDFALVFMLVTSGLRANELCQLRWKDIEFFEGKWTATFIGKGDQEAEQELYGSAVQACKDYFKAQFKREPKPEDHLFWVIPQVKGSGSWPMPYQTVYNHIKKLGLKLRGSGILERELTFTPHLMRRSYATFLYKKGMKIKAIQQKTRHASVDTLINHYIDDTEQASGYLDAVFA